MSISTDGRLQAWTIAKGLEHSTLITLKRMPRRCVAALCKVWAWLLTEERAPDSRLPTAPHAPLRLPPTCRSTSAATAAAAAAGTTSSSSGAQGLPAGSGAKAAATVAALRGAGVVADRDALISRSTGGMSFDFSARDSRIYLAGALSLQVCQACMCCACIARANLHAC